MVRIGTAAAAFGVLTGLWTIAAFYLDGVAHTCPSTGCPQTGPALWGIVVLALSAVLVVDSLVCFVGPRRVFYASALLSAVLAVSVFLSSSFEDVVVYATLGLLGVSFVVSVVAARWETKVSEQSHPMNLPVFG